MTRHTVQRRVRRLEQRPRPSRAGVRSHWDLSRFTDAELELMVPLAEKVQALGHAVAWTAEELALMTELDQASRDRCPSAA